MSVPGAAVAALLRLDPLRELSRATSAVARGLGGAVPAWARAHRRDLAAGLSLLIGVLLLAAGGGLV